MTRIVKMMALFAVCWSAASFAGTGGQEIVNGRIQTGSGLRSLQHRWAEIQYQLPAKQREKAFKSLIGDADALIAANPDQASLYTWRGIIAASYAGAKGGLGALALAKAAKKDLEKALELDDMVLSGAAHTSLGSLYYQVPGWPLGFGDDKLAEQHLRRGLELGPRDIDANFFYGDFLLQQGKKSEAHKYLLQAQAAAPRPGRDIADAGRRSDIEALLNAR